MSLLALRRVLRIVQSPHAGNVPLAHRVNILPGIVKLNCGYTELFVVERGCSLRAPYHIKRTEDNVSCPHRFPISLVSCVWFYGKEYTLFWFWCGLGEWKEYAMFGNIK